MANYVYSEFINFLILKVRSILDAVATTRGTRATRCIAFTNRVGEIAEAEGHHPALLTEWGKVTVTWWTHALKALHHNDFIMAAKTDAVMNRES